MTAATASPPGSTVGRGEVAPAVLARAKAGDGHAFTEVVRHYDRRLRALAFRLLGDRAAMDDALQDAYVKAYRALPRFREDAGLGTWLYQITYRACVDLQRREGRHETTPLDAPAGRAGNPGRAGEGGHRVWERPEAGGADPAATAASRTDLQRALAALPVDQRAAVLLVDAEGLDYDAAASVIGVAPGTIASRLSRARTALRAALAEGEAR